MKNKVSKLARFLNRALYLGSAAMMLAALVLSLSPSAAAATASPGAIWTTNGDCGTSSQDVNHYAVGDHVYINFSNFPAGTYYWQIQQISGNPKPIVASGNYVVGAGGAGCFDAHTVQPNEGGLEYSVDFGVKNDNYQVDSYTAPTATNTAVPTATNTAVPTATSTLLPTATNTLVPTATITLQPTSTSTGEPTATDQPTATATDKPTDEPTATPTDETRATSTTEPTATEFSQEPTSTPVVEVTPTKSPRTVLLPLSIAIDPFCTVDGSVQWTVENPNSVSVTMYSFTVDGGAAQPGFPVAPGEHNLVALPLGTHTVVISYGDAQTVSLTHTLDVCPLQIPVTGSAVLIPVTGADLSGQLGNGLLAGSLSLAGLGLVLTSLRKFLHL